MVLYAKIFVSPTGHRDWRIGTSLKEENCDEKLAQAGLYDRKGDQERANTGSQGQGILDVSGELGLYIHQRGKRAARHGLSRDFPGENE